MLLAILFPGLSMIFHGHLLKGILCIVLQITLIGWIPAAIWGVASRSQDLAEKRHRQMMAAMSRQGAQYAAPRAAGLRRSQSAC